MCEPDDHSEYLIQCQSFIDSSLCEGNKTCSITISSRDYIQCGDKKYIPTYFYVKYSCIQSKKEKNFKLKEKNWSFFISSYNVYR